MSLSKTCSDPNKADHFFARNLLLYRPSLSTWKATLHFPHCCPAILHRAMQKVHKLCVCVLVFVCGRGTKTLEMCSSMQSRSCRTAIKRNDVKGKGVEVKAKNQKKIEVWRSECPTVVCLHPRQNSRLESLTKSPY